MWPVLLHWGILGHHHPMWTSIFALNVSGVTLGQTAVLTIWTLPSASFQILAYFKEKKKIKYIVNLFISDQLYLKH